MGKHTIDQSRSLLDHDINDSFDFDASFAPAHADAPVSIVIDAPPSLSFTAPTYVVYSSDVVLRPAHAPEIVMAEGPGGGHPSGGPTPYSSSKTSTHSPCSALSLIMC